MHHGVDGGAVRGAFLADRERWPLWTPVFMGVGISVYFMWGMEPPLWLGPLAFGGSVVAAIALRREPRGFLAAVAAALIAFGHGAAQLRTYAVDAPILDKFPRSVEVGGRVVMVESHVRGQRIVLDRVEIKSRGPLTVPGRARITLSGSQDVRPGDRILLRASLSPPPRPAAPGAFDFARKAYFEGLGAVGYATGRVRVYERPTGRIVDRVLQRIALIRIDISRQAFEAMPDARGAVAAALLTGDRGRISERSLTHMRDSGLAHLLAISGLHVGLFTGLLFAVCRAVLAILIPVALRYPVKKWAAVLSLIGAFGYLIVTGATIPTQRAFLMISLALIAIVLDRVPVSMTVVAWAAIVILAVAPESLVSVSFQMSFGAVVALVAVYEVLSPAVFGARSRVGLWRRGWLYLAGVLLTTLVAGTATAPFAAFHFNRVATFGLAANLVSVPIMALWIMPWALVTYLLFPFGLPELALLPMAWGIGAVLYVAETVATWPGAVRLIPSMPPAALGLLVTGGLWLSFWTTRVRWLGVIAMALGIVAAAGTEPPDLLIGERGGRFAVRLAQGSYVFSSKRSDFTRDLWLRRLGLSETRALSPRDAAVGSAIRCDSLGCLAVLKGRTVALPKDRRALVEDCYSAGILVSAVPVRGECPTPDVIIDRYDLWREGAHALYIDGSEVRVETAQMYRGDRPWSRRR